MYKKFKGDRECNLYSFFLVRGHSLKELLELTDEELLIYSLAMDLEIELLNERGGI